MKSADSELFPGVEIVAAQPALYLKALDAIVIADLHLGYEAIQVESGVFVPRVQYEKTMKIVEEVADKQRASTVIVLGDVKHEFSETGYHEFKEVLDFLEFLKGKFKRVVVIKGNHDNFVIRMTNKAGVELFEELRMNGFLFTHGHEMPGSTQGYDCIVMGHEHPSIALFDEELRTKEKVKCFLYGVVKGAGKRELNGKKIIVMPALSYFAYGSDVNVTPRSQFLSPILKDFDVDKLGVKGLLEGERILEFPDLGKLRRITR